MTVILRASKATPDLLDLQAIPLVRHRKCGKCDYWPHSLNNKHLLEQGSQWGAKWLSGSLVLPGAHLLKVPFRKENKRVIQATLVSVTGHIPYHCEVLFRFNLGKQKCTLVLKIKKSCFNKKKSFDGTGLTWFQDVCDFYWINMAS